MKIIAFGGGAVGQLGVADVRDAHSKPVFIEGNAWKTVQCGNYHTVALTTHGMLFVWGAGWNGQLGLGKTVQKQPVPRLLSLEENVAVYKLSCGASHTVALSVDRRVFSWGGSEGGDFGFRSVSGFPNGIMLRSIAAGNAFSLALASDGQVFSWGSGLDGRLGVGSTRDYRNPQKVAIPVENNTRIIRVVAGKAHSLALADNGEVFSWGWGTKGQLGHGNEETQVSPLVIKKLKGVVRIAAGESHSVALTDQGQVFTWGGGEQGQLGLGDDVIIQNSPELVSGLPEEVKIARIATGQQHTVAVTDHGDIFAWGNNAFGQLGLGHTEKRAYPEYVDTLPDQAYVAKAEAGERHTILLITDYNPFDKVNAERHRLALQPPVIKTLSPKIPPPDATTSGSAVLTGSPNGKRKSVKETLKSFDDAFAEMENDLLALEDDAGVDDSEINKSGVSKSNTPTTGNSPTLSREKDKKKTAENDVTIDVHEGSSIIPNALKPQNRNCWCNIL